MKLSSVLPYMRENSCLICTMSTSQRDTTTRISCVSYVPAPYKHQHINALRPRQNGHFFQDICKCIFLNENECVLIVPFHKSQCALRCRDPMSKIQNTSSQRSLAMWLTVAANEQNDDWPASVSLVSVQPVIGWLKDEVARHWSHIVHRPHPHGNLPLPCIVRNGVWYCVKYSSLKSFYILQSHPASIPNHEMKFVVVLFGSGGNKSKYIFDIMLVSVRCSYPLRNVQNLGRQLIFCMFNKSSQWLPNTPFASISECLVS